MSSPNPQGFANPYMRCAEPGCEVRVTSRPGVCNVPCGHRAPAVSLCPSWSPVGGCLCIEVFGAREHDIVQ